MNLNRPETGRPSLFDDCEPVVQGRPLLRQDGSSGARAPRFGDSDMWDFNDVVERPPNLSPCSWRAKFSGPLGEPSWNLLAREVLMAMMNPHHETLQAAGVHLGLQGSHVSTVLQTLTHLRKIISWARATDLPEQPSCWRPDDLRRWIQDVRNACSPATVTSHVAFLKRMTVLAPVLTAGWPGDDPWPGRSARQVANYPRSLELSTRAIPPDIWFPLIRAAWTYVHTFAPDILRAESRHSQLQDAARPVLTGRETEIDAWLADPANKIPVYSAKTLPGGQPWLNWRLLDLQVGLLGRPHRSLSDPTRRRRTVLQIVAEGRVTSEGLVSDLRQVSRADGTSGPWHPGIQPQDLPGLRLALRNAAFILVTGLSMMRDSEVHSITRGSVVEHYNSPAIGSTLRKDNSNLPRRHWWISEPVAEAIAVAELVSPHPERVFTGLPRPGKDEVCRGNNAIDQFIDFTNAGQPWSGLDEIPSGRVRPHMFRRTMAMLTDQFPGSEIALGIQLKHIATRALANRSTRGYAAADTAWAEHLESALDTARFRRIRDLYDTHTQGGLIGYGPGAEHVKGVFDQIHATVRARGGDARTEEALLRKARISIRFGLLNNCTFDPGNPAGAVCLENAHVPDGHTGPLDDRCRPDRCRNSMIGTEHVAIYDSHRRIQLKLLQTPGLPACRKELITRELKRAEAVLEKVSKESE